MRKDDYQICRRCIMDTSDPHIIFDNQGVCNHCHTYDALMMEFHLDGESAKQILAEIIEKIKQARKDNEYDCIIGVSGGVDSCYVAYMVKEFGLRPLAVHLDNGWDSELAVKNIEQLLKLLGIELFTHVIDWDEFKDLQLAFLKASTPDSEIPSDHAIASLMRRIARERNIRYILSGCNLRTETHLPRTWSQGHGDWKYIKSIHSRFGTVELKTYPHTDLISQLWYLATQNWVDILNYVDYVKRDAKLLLQEKFCWKDYGGKHHESIYTRFYQGYILPNKFGYDKRRAHCSSLICSGEITREQALEELTHEPYPADLQKQDRDYLLKKFNLTNSEFEEIMNLPKKSYWDYPSYGKSFYNNPMFKAANLIRKRTKSFIKLHSSR